MIAAVSPHSAKIQSRVVPGKAKRPTVSSAGGRRAAVALAAKPQEDAQEEDWQEF